MNILLIEDDEATREMIIGVLKRLGPDIEIEVTENGDEALAHYFERRHDLVITDNTHPGMGGIELIEAIVSKHPLQRFILQTGNSGEHIASFRQQHPDIPLLPKPYQLPHLLDLVKAVAG